MRSTDAALTSVRIHQALTTWFGNFGVKFLHTLHEGENRKQKSGSRQQTAESKQWTADSRQQKREQSVETTQIDDCTKQRVGGRQQTDDSSKNAKSRLQAGRQTADSSRRQEAKRNGMLRNL
jgi:hypothetical protein